MYAAYEGLSPAMRAFVDGLRAVHDITNPLRKAIRDGHSTLDLTEMQEKCPPVEHNVVVTHPETGRRALFVNRNSTTHIVGLSDREQEVMLPFLFDHARSPEYQCRFHWEPGSIAFWDNRSVQHYAVADYHERRIMTARRPRRYAATVARSSRSALVGLHSEPCILAICLGVPVKNAFAQAIAARRTARSGDTDVVGSAARASAGSTTVAKVAASTTIDVAMNRRRYPRCATCTYCSLCRDSASKSADRRAATSASCLPRRCEWS